MKETLKRRGKALSLALLVVFLAVTMLPTTALAAPKKVPSKVNATKVSASSGSVKVRWNKTKNATSYRIYYRPSTTRKWTAVKTVGSKTTRYTYVNSKLKAGKQYYYTVKAYNQNSKKWGKYDVTGKSVTTKKASKPSTPSHTHSWKKHTASKKVWVSKIVPVYKTKKVQVGTRDDGHYETQTYVDYKSCDCGAKK